MIDFSTLKVPTAEERAIADAERNARRYAEDDRERDAGSKKAVTITLEHEPESRTLRSGERVMLLRGTEEGRTKPIVAVYALPARIQDNEASEEAFDRRMRDMGGGDKVTLAGQWNKRVWNDAQDVRRESWEFKTQHFEMGAMPLEKVLEKARAARGEQVETKAPEPVDQARSAARAQHDRNGGMGI